MPIFRFLLASIFSLLPLGAQGTRQDFERAEAIGRNADGLVNGINVGYFWADDESSLVVRTETKSGEFTYLHVDTATGAAKPLIDPDALATSMSVAAASQIPAGHVLLEQIVPATDGVTVSFRALDRGWNLNLTSGEISEADVPLISLQLVSPREIRRARDGGGSGTTLRIRNATAGAIELFWLSGNNPPRSYGEIAPGETSIQNTFAGHRWLIRKAGGPDLAGLVAPARPAIAEITGVVEPTAHLDRGSPLDRPRANSEAPDGSANAFIRNRDLHLQIGAEEIRLSSIGDAEATFEGPFFWSPNSKYLVAFRTAAVRERQIHLIESSPTDQLQPKLRTLDYAKPGDPIRQPLPHLFDVSARVEIPLDPSLFGNPWSIDSLQWAEDSSEFTFRYNARGHQTLALIAVKAEHGTVETRFSDTSDTFIDYSQKGDFRRLSDGRTALWASERSGSNHLYRIDLASGKILNPVTQGDWVMRELVSLDEESGQALIRIFGYYPDQDPYYSHFARVHLDGSGFAMLTTANGNHAIEFSPARNFLISEWSRVDQPPVRELRDAHSGKKLADLGAADDSSLVASGWIRPERFSALGRDGKSEIFGVIYRPSHFDPEKSYPVIEDVYAGPHDFFVPKSWAAWSRRQAIAELGFIIVKIDGMGTNWRTKAFHDVAWKNLVDGGFPDRIAWIRAAAETRPYMDLSRVGIFGGSAGGQNALAALLHHGNFYKVGVADCGCHDNRMDKIWWNEAWMGWPVDDSYTTNSNVTAAHLLTGKLMLIVGELDSNVDPASTMQVVAALQKADKDFEHVIVANAGHGAAESPYGHRRRCDFLIRNLLGTEPRAEAAAP